MVAILLIFILWAFPAHAACTLSAIPTTAIHVDQFGYQPAAQKVAVIADPQTGYNASVSYTPGSSMQVRNASTGIPVFTGSPVAWNSGATHTQSGDKVWWFDFSALTTLGTFYVYDPQNNTKSDAFTIAGNAYLEVLKHAVRMFYYQRAGFEKTEEYAGIAWADTAALLGTGQDSEARLITDPGNAATAKDLRGGWFDAGDLNKYTTFASDALTDLLLAYEQYPSIWGDDYNIPESGNGIPDILDEVKYELDWLLLMQQVDGSVLSKVSFVDTTWHSSPPSTDTTARYYGIASTASTAAAAASFAHASKIFTSIGQTAYGTTLATAAVNAWNWTVANPSVAYANTGFTTVNPDPPSGAYGILMHRLRAATWLYALTGTGTYKTFFDANYASAQPMLWTYWYAFEYQTQAALLYYTTTAGATSGVVSAIRASKTSSIGGSEFLPAVVAATDAYRAYMKDADYTFGNNRDKAQIAHLYLDMVRYNLDVSNQVAYEKAGADYLHYLHGINPMDMVYLTNMYAVGATRSANELYHSWFWDGTVWDNALTSTYGPPPGLLTGGANPTYTGNQSPPLGQPIQKFYRDWNGVGASENSYEITEPGIYYQAAYVRLLGSFVALTP